MDKMREEFETWFCSTIPYPIARESWFAIMDDGDYIITDVQAAWAGWKASRAALCVDLPQPDDDSQDAYVRRLEFSLDEAGVSYK